MKPARCRVGASQSSPAFCLPEVGFSSRQCRRLRTLRPLTKPLLPHVLDPAEQTPDALLRLDQLVPFGEHLVEFAAHLATSGKQA